MKNVLIFGATGTVGAYASLHFAALGYYVIAVGHRPSDNHFFIDYNIEYLSVDVTRYEGFSVLPNQNVDAVVILSGLLPARMKGYFPQQYIDVNCTGMLNVLNYCAKVNVAKVIYAQTISDAASYFNSPKAIPSDITPSFPLDNDHSIYTITKNSAVSMLKHYAHHFHFDYYILRFPNIYVYHPNPYYYVDGVQRWQSYRLMIAKAQHAKALSIWGNPLIKRDVVYVKDCCQIIERCVSVDSAPSGTYNVGTGIGVTIEEQVKGIADVFVPSSKSIKINYESNKPDMVGYIMDVSKTCSVLGYKPKYSYLDYLLDFKIEFEQQRFIRLWGEDLTSQITNI